MASGDEIELADSMYTVPTFEGLSGLGLSAMRLCRMESDLSSDKLPQNLNAPVFESR
jgi:hypothetical protein